MANFVSELNSLDFSKYIGGPMQAAVDAQGKTCGFAFYNKSRPNYSSCIIHPSK